MSLTQAEQTSYNTGDPVKVSDREGEYYGVVIGVDEELTVQMIARQPDSTYHITEDAYVVPHRSITEHKALGGNDDHAPKAYSELGFRMLDGSSFARYSDDEGDTLVPVGDAEFELISDDDDSDYGSMSEFIVEDGACEPFTHADPSIAFVQETHQAVRAFNDWVPSTEQEHSARDFIQGQESRAVQIDDEIRFAQGKPGVNYSRPD